MGSKRGKRYTAEFGWEFGVSPESPRSCYRRAKADRGGGRSGGLTSPRRCRVSQWAPRSRTVGRTFPAMPRRAWSVGRAPDSLQTVRS